MCPILFCKLTKGFVPNYVYVWADMSCFQGLFFCPEAASLLLHNFCIYHISPPGHEVCELVNWTSFLWFCYSCVGCYCSHDLFWHFHKSSCSWELLLSVQMSLCLLLMTWQIKLLRFSTILGKDVNKNLLIIYYLITCWGLNSSLNQF